MQDWSCALHEKKHRTGGSKGSTCPGASSEDVQIMIVVVAALGSSLRLKEKTCNVFGRRPFISKCYHQVCCLMLLVGRFLFSCIEFTRLGLPSCVSSHDNHISRHWSINVESYLKAHELVNPAACLSGLSKLCPFLIGAALLR